MSRSHTVRERLVSPMRWVGVLLVGGLSAIACSGGTGSHGPDEKVLTTTQAVTATASISGQARDAKGNPLKGVVVTLVGPSPSIGTTDVNGNYAFSQLQPGSYVATPAYLGCGFVPAIATLNNVSGAVTQNFDGSGLTCGGFAVGRLTISGEVNDANGLPLSGVTVKLTGPTLGTQTTDANGKYAFTQVVPGSYIVQPLLSGCSFSPSLADLDNVTDSTTQFFGGSGSTCGGKSTVSSGATSGPLTLSGHLRDASGAPIVGGRVDLSGGDTAVRFSDFAGAYAFHVSPGLYSLSASGACTLSPSSTTVAVLANTTQDFQATGSGCTTSTTDSLGPAGAVFAVKQGGSLIGITTSFIDPHSSAADASSALQQIAAETAAPRSLTIAGYPAIERQVVLPAPQTEDPSPVDVHGNALGITTAIAVGATVVRLESHLFGDSSAATIASFLATGRSFSPDQLSALHGPPMPIVPSRSVPRPPLPTSLPESPGAITDQNVGEVQVAAAEGSNTVVYATQLGHVFVSTNGGATKTESSITRPGSGVAASGSLSVSGGDPAVAVGAAGSVLGNTASSTSTENFYYVEMANDARSLALYSSADGSSFTGGLLTDCSASSTCSSPDQPQIVADRNNAEQFLLADGVTMIKHDIVYVAWRLYDQMGATHPVLTCSTDSGQSWAPIDYSSLEIEGADAPRLTVGADGYLYVAYITNPYPGAPAGTVPQLWVAKYSGCGAATNPFKQLSKTFVADVTDVTPMAGLERVPIANYMIAADDTFANQVFVVYSTESSAATSTSLPGDDIHVKESIDAAGHFGNDTVLNTTSSGQRYNPSICSSHGTNFVTWYDRRDALVTSHSDFQGYYERSVADPGATTLGTTGVTVGAENFVSGIDDAACLGGFLPGVRDSKVEESQCTYLPTGAAGGECQRTCTSTEAFPGQVFCSSHGFQPCLLGTGKRLDGTSCPTGEVCSVVHAVTPKYGDYNGVGCAQGKAFMVWGSALPPNGACIPNGMTVRGGQKCCSGSQTGVVCAPSSSSCVANAGTCATASDCCSGNCSPGLTCLPMIQLYTGSTKCSATDTFCGSTANALDPVEIRAAAFATCVRLSGGSVKCWGSNQVGDLGDGTNTDHAAPALVSGLSNITALSGNAGFKMCALREDRAVFCWGGTPDSSNNTPSIVSGVTLGATNIASGLEHACAVLLDGTMSCWGGGIDYELGDQTSHNITTAVQVNGLSGVAVAAATGNVTSCAVLNDGTVQCWGQNAFGTIANGTGVKAICFPSGPCDAIDVKSPTQTLNPDMSALTGVISLSARWNQFCALLTDGTVSCWGDGELFATPVMVSSTSKLGNVVQVAGGESHWCAVLGDHTIKCWGDNSSGQLGDGTTNSTGTPVTVSGVTNAVQVAAGANHTCALMADQTVYCWGAVPGTGSSLTPTKISF